MSLPLKRQTEKQYTYRDYLQWDEGERCELIEGIAFDMAPAPSRQHQDILRELLTLFSIYLKDKKCRVYPAPFDVRLPAGEEKDEDIKTVVQPDISVICDSSKLDEKGCRGAPDLIIEITSPSTSKKDMIFKLSLYEKAGVKEYWIVWPEGKTVMVFKLSENGKYGRPEVYSDEDTVKVGIFKDFEIDMKNVFEK
jgi:Uma2 family endonuclease